MKSPPSDSAPTVKLSNSLLKKRGILYFCQKKDYGYVYTFSPG